MRKVWETEDSGLIWSIMSIVHSSHLGEFEDHTTKQGITKAIDFSRGMTTDAAS
jgi:hypothetical protein